MDLSSIFEDLKPLMNILHSMVLNDDQDQLLWENISNGIYSVALGYQAMTRQDSRSDWAKAWFPSLIPIINIFI